MSNDLINKNQEIKIIEWQGQVVITTKDIAYFHGLEVRVINQKFRRNQKHFTINHDYFIATKNDFDNTLESQRVIQDLFVANNQLEVYLFTKRGYFKFVKTINDDKAWEIYNNLIESYFNDNSVSEVNKRFLEKSKTHRKGLAVQWSRHEAVNYAYLTISEYESLFGNSDIRKKDMDDEELTLLIEVEPDNKRIFVYCVKRV